VDTVRDEIHPQIALAHAAARRAGAYASVEKRTGIAGNGFLELLVDLDDKRHGHIVCTCKGTGETFRLAFAPQRIGLAEGQFDASTARIAGFEAQNTPQLARISVHIDYGCFNMETSYAIQRGQHVIQKSIVIHGIQQPLHLQRASLFRQTAAPGCQVLLHDGGIYYPIVFLRGRRNSLFFCVDFPGYFASVEGADFELYYLPDATLEPGRGYRLLTAHVGICELTGRSRVNPYHETAAHLDVGEQQWFREYISLGRQPIDAPLLEIEAPGLGIAGPSELEVLDQCAWLGAKHVLMPRIVASLDSHPLATTVKNRIRDENIHAALLLQRDMPESQVPGLDTAIHREFDACVSLEEIDRILVDRYLTHVDRHGLRDAELTGRPITPSDAGEESEFARMESIHRALQGLVEIVATLREESSHVTCFGAYGSYGIGVSRLSDGLSLIAEEHPLALPDIHVGRLFADMQRLYFRRSLSFLLPRTSLITSVGLVPQACPNAPYPGADHYPWYLYHDRAGWRYGIISAIAVGLRHRFHAMPHDMSPEDRAFAVKWLRWEKEHLAGHLHVDEILGEPGIDPVDGYSYATQRGAIVFLFNTSWQTRQVALTLRLAYDADYVARELYPREYAYLGPDEGLFHKNGVLNLSIAPKEAKIVEVVRRSPASARRKRAEIFGAEGSEHKEGITIAGDLGARLQVGIRIGNRFQQQEVRLPGKPLETDVSEWMYTERLLEHGCTTLTNGGFAGKPLTPDVSARRNVWLAGKINIAPELEARVNTSPFTLHRPCWTYDDRLFFVIRFEPEMQFDPIRTSSGIVGEPEGYKRALPIKCGFDLATRALQPRAWINGVERPVYPALAAWNGYSPNPWPVVTHFFEASSLLRYGRRNHVVLYMANFDPKAFRGLHLEHAPQIRAEKTLELP